LLDLALEKLVNPGHTRFTNALAINNENGKASLDLDLTYQGPPDGMTLNSTTLPTLTPDQLLALVRGKVDFGFDPALFPLAALFLEHPAIAKEDERYVAHLELAGDRLVLNGEDMTLEAFIALLEPDAGGLLMDPGDLEDGEPVDGDMPNSGQGEDGMMDAEPTGDEAVDDGSMVDEPEMIPAATPAAGEAGTETAPVPAR